MFNRGVKWVGSEILHGLDGIGTSLWRAVGGTPKASCIVLYYHAVRRQDKDMFSAQMRELARLTVPLRTDYFGPLENGRRYSMVTFDDGFESVIANALPILRRYKVPATLFVPTGYLGRPPDWGRYAGESGPSESVISKDTVRSLRHDPLLEIGSHSVSHRSLPGLSKEMAWHELVDSKQSLESLLEREVQLFSFPHGRFEGHHLNSAMAAGYRRVFSIAPTVATCDTSGGAVGRFAAGFKDSRREFHLKLVGAYRWMSLTTRGHAK